MVRQFGKSRKFLSYRMSLLMGTDQVTASQLINFSVMSFTFIRWRKACQAQGLTKEKLPYYSRFQPFLAYYALTGCFIMTFVGGYTVFLPGMWSIPTFLFSYTMIGVFPVLFIGWKIFRKTKFLGPEEVDLFQDVEEIEEYTRNYVPRPTK